MPPKHLRKAIDIRAYVLEQETKANFTNNRDTGQKRRLLMEQDALRRAYEEIDHFHSKCTEHILEKTTFKEELKKISEKASRVT